MAIHPWLRLCLLAPGLLLASCASQSPGVPSASPIPVEQRLDDVERRLQRLESRSPVLAPQHTREEIQDQIDQFERDRARLLLSYTEQYPGVRDIDRKLAILRQLAGQLSRQHPQTAR